MPPRKWRLHHCAGPFRRPVAGAFRVPHREPERGFLLGLRVVGPPLCWGRHAGGRDEERRYNARRQFWKAGNSREESNAISGRSRTRPAATVTRASDRAARRNGHPCLRIHHQAEGGVKDPGGGRASGRPRLLMNQWQMGRWPVLGDLGEIFSSVNYLTLLWSNPHLA